MASPQQKLQALTEEFQDLQKTLTETVEARQKLESQQHETRNVKKEFDELDDDSQIYKLVGPVLMKQDKDEAKLNVAKRLELIESQMTAIEEKIKGLQDKGEEKKVQIIQLQTQLQEGAAGGAAGGPSV